MNELKQIREALNLSQAEMGALFGVKQGVYQRWEVAPNSAKAREVTDQAKEIYRKRTKKDWEGVALAAGGITSEQHAREVGRLDGRLDEQGAEIRRLRRRLEEAFVLIQDLGRRAGIELPPQEPAG